MRIFIKINDFITEYGLWKKLKTVIVNSGVLGDIKRQMADFALVAVTQAEFSFNSIGEEKKKIAFRMICNYVKYPLAVKPFKRIIENLLYDWISEEIERAVKKIKERLQNEIIKQR